MRVRQVWTVGVAVGPLVMRERAMGGFGRDRSEVGGGCNVLASVAACIHIVVDKSGRIGGKGPLPERSVR